MTALKTKFAMALCCDTPDDPVVEEEFNVLVAHYEERHRYYHTLKHVIRMLLLADAMEIDEPSITLATFFHDVIYRPGSLKNEEKSAALAGASLARLQVDAGRIDQVTAMILATSSHLSPQDDPLIGTFLDLDMSILGAPRDEYAAYADGVRREYPWLPGFVFRRHRRQFLEKMLSGDHIFHTAVFRERFEEKARGNIRAELAQYDD